MLYWAGSLLPQALNTMPHDKALKNPSTLAMSTLYPTAPDGRGIAYRRYERGRTAFGLGPQPAGCGCTREDPGTLIGPGSLSPDRWVYGGAWGGGHHPALIQRPGGPSGSSSSAPQVVCCGRGHLAVTRAWSPPPLSIPKGRAATSTLGHQGSDRPQRLVALAMRQASPTATRLRRLRRPDCLRCATKQRRRSRQRP